MHATTVATDRGEADRPTPQVSLRQRIARPTVLLLLVVAALVACGAAFVATGGSVLVVESPSMGRAAPVGTLVVDQRVPFDSLRVGDVISYRPPDSAHTVTHRVAEVVAGGVRTRGDVNGAVDAWTVRPSMIVGRATALLPGAGWLVRLGPWVALGILAVSCLTLPISSPTVRAGLRLLGACAVVSVVVAVQRPLAGWSVLTQTPMAEGVEATVVGTGLLPVRLTASDGTSVLAAPGQVVHLLLPPDSAGRVAFDSTLGLDWLGWCGIVLACLTPLLAVLAAGLPAPEPDPTG